VVQLVACGRDISLRKRAEEALRISEERLDLAFAGADLGLWDWNIRNGAVFYNARWATMLGYALDEIEPNYDGWARLVHPDDMPHVQEVLRTHLEGKTPHYEVEHRLLTRSGEWLWVLTQGKVLEREPHGAALRAAGTHMDISARKGLEARVRQQQNDLCRAQGLTLAGELAATVAHELNQPLAAITHYAGAATIGFRELLDAHPALRNMFEDILRLSNRAADVIRGIRNLVRTHKWKPEWLALHTLVDEIFSLVRGDLTRKEIRLVLDIPVTLPKIWAGRIQLQQVLLNLILNAIDAMSRPEISHRELKVGAGLNRDHEVEITISDTGPGISPEIAKRLFEPFVTTKPDGIGLGLSICRTIVEAHGGRISAHSLPGDGATFEVILPAGKGMRHCAD
jgi:PAS domain S-box-containing protein